MRLERPVGPNCPNLVTSGSAICTHSAKCAEQLRKLPSMWEYHDTTSTTPFFVSAVPAPFAATAGFATAGNERRAVARSAPIVNQVR
jgi:hypothetical protein